MEYLLRYVCKLTLKIFLLYNSFMSIDLWIENFTQNQIYGLLKVNNKFLVFFSLFNFCWIRDKSYFSKCTKMYLKFSSLIIAYLTNFYMTGKYTKVYLHFLLMCIHINVIVCDFVVTIISYMLFKNLVNKTLGLWILNIGTKMQKSLEYNFKEHFKNKIPFVGLKCLDSNLRLAIYQLISQKILLWWLL